MEKIAEQNVGCSVHDACYLQVQTLDFTVQALYML